MRTLSPWLRCAAAVLFLLSGRATTAQADPITVTAMGAGFGAENDIVALFPATSWVADPFSTPARFEVQWGNLHVEYSPSMSPPYALTLSRLITIDGVSRMLTQHGELSITPTIDTLTIFASRATAFDLGARGTLFLTLDGFTRSARVIGDFPFPVVGTLSAAAPVPEPATLVLLGSGLAFAAGRARWRRRR